MSNLAVTGSQVLVGILLLALLIGGVILFLRNMLKKNSESDLAENYRDKSGASTLQIFNKYPEVDPFRYSGMLTRFGIAAALIVTLLAFNWTTYEDGVYIPEGALDFEDEVEIEPPRTAEPPPPPPPPPPPVIEEVPEELIEEEVEFTSAEVLEEEIVEAPPPAPEPEAPPAPPPPPPPPPKEKEIFSVVEDMPRFPGCEDEPNKEKRKQCAQEKMLKYIYKNIKYPPVARENGIEGMAVIQFVVDETGKVKKPKVVRPVAGGCSEEALRVVKKMAGEITWIPGKQRGQKVPVYFNLPVRFKLE